MTMLPHLSAQLTASTEVPTGNWRALTALLSTRLQTNFLLWLENPQSSLTTDLLNGAAGLWFALYQYQKINPSEVSEAFISEGLEALVERSRQLWPNLSSCYGLAGVGWLLEYLKADQNWHDDHNEELHQVYWGALTAGRWQGDFEYVLGLTGFAPFILRRASQQATALPLADAWLSQVEALAQQDKAGGSYWVTAANSAFRIIRHNPLYQEVNLGLAHGMTGVLHCLCKVAELPELRTRALALLSRGVDFLLLQQNAEPVGSLYPNLAGKPAVSRLGWCYGDLPVVLLLARLAKLTGDATYLAQAKLGAKACVSRTAEAGSIADAGLCHGACGVYLLLYQLEQWLPGTVPTTVFAYWQRWLELYVGQREVAAEGVGRFFAAQHQPCDGLLEGDAGVLLALLVMQGQAADWLDLLLIA